LKLLNKVAGVYGLIAVLTGAGGSFAQLSLYIYSVIALVALVWGLNAVKRVRNRVMEIVFLSHFQSQEDPKHTLYFAHLFFADHILSTAWTIFFAVSWWLYTPHDGRRQANSKAQEEMMKTGVTIDGHTWTTEERVEAAMIIWNKEKGTAAAFIALSWIVKVRMPMTYLASRLI
jgi:inositol phosphorylceramide synthase regulatory subunit